MTPFAHRLRAARTALGISQGELSACVGYRQSYISAIECGVKLPKDEELVDRTIAALELTDDEAQLLRSAFQQSQLLSLPPGWNTRVCVRCMRAALSRCRGGRVESGDEKSQIALSRSSLSSGGYQLFRSTALSVSVEPARH
ncbi:helix-turn-helix domain-containing protein [Pandoraea horticolens]|uniref:helix-turn-helix domain-containing protein n=1 Tax=Pandoraea horticolens TaxID=2508298 RepID=UPI001241224A